MTRADELLEEAKDEIITDGTVLVWIFATLLALKTYGDLDVSWRGVFVPVIFLVSVAVYHFGRAAILTRREVRRARSSDDEG